MSPNSFLRQTGATVKSGRSLKRDEAGAPLARASARAGLVVAGLLALAKLALHLAYNNRYDYFRDEFNYMACGEHPAWGYVDHPPMIPFLVRICRAVFGDSLRSIRLVPAIGSSLLLVLTALIARELGGRRFALVLSAVAVLVAPIYLSDGSLLTTNCLEPLFWMGCAYAAVRAVSRNEPRMWLLFGILAGLGLEEKYSIAIFGFGVAVGLLATPERRALGRPWIWLGGALAFLLFLPNLLWNVAHHFPFGQLMAHIKESGRDIRLTPWGYFGEQILLTHPVASPIWITGLCALLFSRRLRPYRFLGISYLVCFACFVLLGGKNYYLTPVYPALFAAGSVVIEEALERCRARWPQPLILGVLLLAGAWLLPIPVPVLDVDHFVDYMRHLPLEVPRSEKSHLRAVLPQHYADQFGWEAIVDEVALAYSRLDPEERKDCAIFAQDYGQAGAIDFYGPARGLPKAVSGHQTYWLWGPRGYSGRCLVVLDDDRPTLETLFKEVSFVGSSRKDPYALEQEIPVFICRGPKFGTLEDLGPRVQKWR